MNSLPIYRVLIPDEECGMFRVSLVDDPAVQSHFLAFDGIKRMPLYAIADEEKRLVRGVIMRANYPIYRVSPDLGEFYLVFEPRTIRLMAEKYLAEGRQNAVNVMHIDGSDVEGVDMVQLFIKDSQAGISPASFEEIEDGSLFGEYHVLNEEIWLSIKDGTFKGFSLEGVFDLELMPKENRPKQDNQFTNTKEMKVTEKLRNLMLELLAETEKFGQVATDKGLLRWEGEEDLREGYDVVHVAEDGTETKPEDGDYTTEDGKIIKVTEGKVAELLDPKAEVAGAENKAEQKAAEEPDPFEEILKRIDSIDERIGIIEKKLEKNDIQMSEATSQIEELKKAPAEKSVKEKMSQTAKDGRLGKLAKNLNM